MRKARIEKGYTQKRLAELVGVKQGTISAIEKKRRYPSLKVAKRIARILEVPLSLIAGDE